MESQSQNPDLKTDTHALCESFVFRGLRPLESHNQPAQLQWLYKILQLVNEPNIDTEYSECSNVLHLTLSLLQANFVVF